MKKRVFSQKTKALSETVVYPDGSFVTSCTYNKFDLAEDVTEVTLPGRLKAEDGGRLEFRPKNCTGVSNLEGLEHTEGGYLLVYKDVMLMTQKLNRHWTAKQFDEAVEQECKRLKREAKKYLIKKAKKSC